MTDLEVFRIPSGMLRELVGFGRRQPIKSLSSLVDDRSSLSKYFGVYFIYYRGHSELYKPISELNFKSFVHPIYIGKAVSGGARTGSGNSGHLYGRLSEHKRSILSTANLDPKDFYYQVIAMEVDLVAWAESALIRYYQPVWNSLISGFGIHAPGAGRLKQERSIWDQLHPGRGFSMNLPVHRPVDAYHIQSQVREHTVKYNIKPDNF